MIEIVVFYLVMIKCFLSTFPATIVSDFEFRDHFILDNKISVKIYLRLLTVKLTLVKKIENIFF